MSEQREKAASARKAEQQGDGVRLGHRALRWAGRIVAGVLLLVLGTLGSVLILLHTDAGDALLTSQVPALVKSLQPGLTMEVAAVRAPLPTELEIRGLRLADDKGCWLELEAARIVIPFASLLPGFSGWHPEVELVEMRNLRVMRVPEFPPAAAVPDAVRSPAPLTLLPSWMTLRLREMRLSGLQLGSALLSMPGRRLEGSMQAQAAVGERTATVHVDIPAVKLAKVPEDDVSPVPEEREGTGGELVQETAGVPVQQTPAGEGTAEHADKEEPSHLTLDLELAGDVVTLALKAADTSFLPYFVPALRGAALDTHLRVEVPLVPPAPEGPLRATMQSRFSLVALALPEVRQESALSLHAAWDGQRFTLENIGLDMPKEHPQLSLHGGGGFDPVQGPGASLQARVADLQLVGRLLGMSPQALAGSLEALITLGHGQRPIAWWERNGQASAGTADEALRAVVQVTSPQLTLPGGQIQKLEVRIAGEGVAGSAIKDGLPDAVSGTMRCAAASLFGMGAFTGETDWRIHGLNGTGLRAAVKRLSLVLPGMKMRGDLRMDMSAGTAGPLLDGDLEASVTNWNALARLSGTALSGATATAKLTAGVEKDKQSLKLHWNVQRLAVGDSVQIRSCRGDVTSTDLYGVLEALQGALRGKAVDPDGSLLNAGMALGSGQAGGIRWDAATFKAQVQDAQASVQTNVQGALAATVQASFRLQDLLLRIQTLQVRDSTRELGVRLEHPVDISLKDGVDMKMLRLSFMPQGSLQLMARYLPSHVALETSVEGIPLHLVRSVSDIPVFGGMLSLHAHINGNPEAPQGEFTVTAADIPVGNAPDSPAATVSVNGRLGKSQGDGIQPLQLEASLSGLEDSMAASAQGLTATASLPVRFGKAPGLVMDGPLRAKLFWRGALAPLWRFVPMPGRTLRGEGEVSANVSGTLRTPRITAGLFVGGAVFEDMLEGIQLRDIALEARYASHGKSLVRLSASDGRGGTMSLDGALLDVATQPRLLARGIIRKLRPLHRDDLAVQLSGTMAVSGPLMTPKVQADITLDQGAFQIMNIFGGSVTTLENVVYTTDGRRPVPEAGAGGSSSESGPVLDIRFRAPGRFFIRGKGLDSEWKADLKITGEASNPRLTGVLAPVRGSFDFIGRSFSFGDSEITFDGSMNPLLDLDLEYKTTQFTAQILVTGTARRPRLNLSSIPESPKDEIMAQILFGKDINSLSRYEAIQAAAAVASLLSGNVAALDILTTARDTLGLDSLRVGSSDADRQKSYKAPRDASQQGQVSENSSSMSPTLEAGKYITDKIYVGVEQGTDPGSGTAVHVNIDVLPNVSLEGRTSSESSGIGINWKKDY